MRRGIGISIAIVLAGHAHADPLRLRADALASTASPAGLLVLEAGGAPRPGLSAEAVVWLAGARAPGDTASGDVLVIAVEARSSDRRARARLGRFVASLGALRPVHVDGGALRVQLPRRFDAEAVAGIPVLPGLATARSWDWVAGGRISRRLGDGGSVGISYLQRRDAGVRASEELGADAGAALGARADLGARLAYDLVNPGLAEVGATASYRRARVRTELYAIHRAASHLLPATSLFSVIGDVPSQRAGAVVTWRAAPRLDVVADLGARRVGATPGLPPGAGLGAALGPELAVRARLRLDDRGASALTGELRRSGVGDGSEAGEDSSAWSGLRGAARIALPRSLVLSTELELVIPDVDRGRGAVWPWALASLGWERCGWQAAIAVEASASPEFRHRVDVLGQLVRRWGTR